VSDETFARESARGLSVEPINELEGAILQQLTATGVFHGDGVGGEGSNVRGPFVSGALRQVASECEHDVVVIADVGVEGPIDLGGIDLPARLELTGLSTEAPIGLAGAGIGSLLLRRCAFGGIDLTLARITDDLVLDRCRADRPLPLRAEPLVVAGRGFETHGTVGPCLSLRGATVGGDLRLSGLELHNPLGPAITGRQLHVMGMLFIGDGSSFVGEVAFPNCVIGGEFACTDTTFRTHDRRALALGGARLGASLWLTRSGQGRERPVHLHGELSLPGAHVAGIVRLRGTVIHQLGKVAIDARNTQIGGSVELEDRASIEGEAKFVGAQITGDLEGSGCTLSNPGKRALHLGRAQIGGRVRLRAPFTCRGGLRMTSARIGDMIDLSGGVALTDAEDRPRDMDGRVSIYAPRLAVAGDVLLDSLVADGIFFLSRAQIGGRLGLEGAAFGDGTKALRATGLEARRGIQLGRSPRTARPTTCSGSVELAHAETQGPVELAHARIVAPGGTALTLEAARIGGSLDLSRSEVDGSTNLAHIHVGHAIVASGARLSAATALVLDGAQLSGNVDLDEGFAADGAISVVGAAIGGSLALNGGSFQNPAGEAVLMINTTVAGSLGLLWKSVDGRVRLDGSTVSALIDDPDHWPTRVSLGGFTFQRYGPERDPNRRSNGSVVGATREDGAPTDRIPASAGGPGGPSTETKDRTVRRWHRGARLEHLSRLDPFEIGPYEQVASVFRRHGFDDDADAIVMAGRRAARRRTPMQPHRRLLDWLYDRVLGFGYRPGRVLYVLAAMIGLFALALALPGADRAFRATDSAGNSYTPTGRLVTVVPHVPEPDVGVVPSEQSYRADPCDDGMIRCFRPLSYAIDAVVPLIDLGQRSTWHADVHAPNGRLYETLGVIATLAGWVLSSVVLVGFSRLTVGRQ
jgi:hypothetical protein